MKGRYDYLFYLAAVICFGFVIFSVVSQSPNILPPKEYVYVLKEESGSDLSQSELSVSSDTPSDAASKASASSSKISAPIKKYISSNSQKPSAPASSEILDGAVTSKSDMSSIQTMSSEEAASENPESEGEEAASKPSSKPVEDNTSMININTATQTQLMTLDGIGEVLSQRIIEMRNSIGGFKSIDEIKLVSGIGEKTFEKIADRLTV